MKDGEYEENNKEGDQRSCKSELGFLEEYSESLLLNIESSIDLELLRLRERSIYGTNERVY